MTASELFPAGVYPPMTNSWALLIRIFFQAPERRPDSYLLFRCLATKPSSPCCLAAFIRSGRGADRSDEYRMGSARVGTICCSRIWRLVDNDSFERSFPENIGTSKT